MEHRGKVVLVTGASSGIGNACATYLAKNGYRVYGTSRNPASYSRKADEYFEMLAMDVTDDLSIRKAMDIVLTKEGQLDTLICNAGMGIAGSVEDTSIKEIGIQMDTNFLGTVRCIKAVLPTMRHKKSGRIIVLSSILGLMGSPFQAFYSASKFALEGFIESLRYEMRPFGIDACLIEPGNFKTGFTDARLLAPATENSIYKKYYDAAMAIQIDDEKNGDDPLKIAKLIASIMSSRKLRVRYSVGPAVERFSILAKRAISGRAFEFVFRKFYHLP